MCKLVAVKVSMLTCVSLGLQAVVSCTAPDAARVQTKFLAFVYDKGMANMQCIAFFSNQM